MTNETKKRNPGIIYVVEENGTLIGYIRKAADLVAYIGKENVNIHKLEKIG